MGILDHKEFFAQKIKTKNFTTQKFYNAKVSRCTVCMCVHYMEGAMYVLPRGWYVVCACVLRGGLYVYVYTHTNLKVECPTRKGCVAILHRNWLVFSHFECTTKFNTL